MALFGKKSEKKVETAAAEVKKGGSVARNLTHVLSQARITEKATMQQEGGIYTFNVADDASKSEVAQAVKALYKVTPRLVRILKVPQKVRRNARTGKIGIKSGGKKAYVYLKKGESITIS